MVEFIVRHLPQLLQWKHEDLQVVWCLFTQQC